MDFSTHFRNYTVRHSDRIKSALEKLQQNAEISHFCYYTLGSDGSHSALLSNPELAEYYASSELYHQDSLLSHPDNFGEGTILWSCLSEHQNDGVVNTMLKKFNMSHGFTIVRKNPARKMDLEAFSFAAPASNPRLLNFFINNPSLFHSFCSQFKQDVSQIIAKAQDNPIDLGKAKGHAFVQKTKMDFGLPLRSSASHAQSNKLSKRERECLELSLKGKTAKQIGELLGLSTRTIEHYVDNIKNKYGCNTKSELFDHCLNS